MNYSQLKTITPESIDLAEGCTNLSDQYAIIKISGADSKKFLQGQLTCDIAKLSDTKWSYGGHCNRKGRLISSFMMWRDGDGFYLLLPKSMAEIATTALNKYAVFSKVDLAEVSDEWHIQGFLGEASKNMLTQQFDNLPNKAQEFQPTKSNFTFCLPGENRFLTVTQQKIETKLNKISFNYWALSDIKNTIAWILPETSEIFIPQMLDFDKIGAVSFTKGCYIGQEIIARTQHLGKLKRHMVLLKINNDEKIETGSEISKEGNAVGNIVNAAKTKEGSPLSILLAVLTTNDIGQIEVG